MEINRSGVVVKRKREEKRWKEVEEKEEKRSYASKKLEWRKKTKTIKTREKQLKKQKTTWTDIISEK